eukprot:6201272-Pleurochrysis_carterae.AAC.1
MVGVIFLKKVVDMKAWELYIGQSVWFFFIGILFYILRTLLDLTALGKNALFQQSFDTVQTLGNGSATARDADKFMDRMFDPPRSTFTGAGVVPYA